MPLDTLVASNSEKLPVSSPAPLMSFHPLLAVTGVAVGAGVLVAVAAGVGEDVDVDARLVLAWSK